MATAARKGALRHPRRQLLLDLIRRDPGVSFRELARQANCAVGTVRHHLNVLLRLHLLVERRRGCMIHLFDSNDAPNHWMETVLRREPFLSILHDWLKAHPRSTQGTVLEAMEAQGWSRTTTQHRLHRLVAGGAATVFLRGRYKLYSASKQQIATSQTENAKPLMVPA